MAINRWLGIVAPMPQIITVLCGNPTATGDVYTMILSTGVGTGWAKVFYVSVSGDTLANVATGLIAAGSASTAPGQFLELTFAANGVSGGFTVTGPANGAPFILSISHTNSTGTTETAPTITYVQFPTGPNDVSNATNWSLVAVPTNTSDTVEIDNCAESLLYSVTTSNTPLTGGAITSINQPSITCANLAIGPNFTGQIGLPQLNSNQKNAPFVEWRPTSVAVSCTTAATINAPNCSLMRLAFGSANATAINVLATGVSAESGLGALVLDVNNAGATLAVLGGSVGIGTITKATNEVNTLQVGQASLPVPATSGPAITFGNQNSSGSPGLFVRTGPFVQFAGAITQSAGTMMLDTTGGSTLGGTITNEGGLLNVIGSAAITTLNVYAGTCFWSSSGTITTANIGSKGTLDFSQDLRSKTVTNAIKLAAGATLNDPNKVVGTLAWNPVDCTNADVTVNAGYNPTLTRS